MWTRLDDQELLAKYRSGFSPGRPAPQAIVELLSALARESFAPKVWAVTTHNVLRLTTAPSYTVEEEHPAVWVGARNDSFVVSFAKPGASQTSDDTPCGQDALLITVARFINDRLLRSRA